MQIRRAHVGWLSLALIGALSMLWLRKEAHGLGHALSPEYWSDRIAGRDLFDQGHRYLKHGARDLKEVALTFDDGPHPASAQRILRILRQEDVKATFFLVGSRIKEHPDLVREIVREGHLVGNHTQDHIRLTNLRIDQIAKELRNCETNFARAVPGHSMAYFRPPGMRFNGDVLSVVQKEGYVMAGWSEAAKDFISAHHPQADPELIRQHIVDQVENGSIILLHDIPATAEVLQSVIESIKRQGYRFVTLDEMMDHLPGGGPSPRTRAKIKP